MSSGKKGVILDTPESEVQALESTPETVEFLEMASKMSPQKHPIDLSEDLKSELRDYMAKMPNVQAFDSGSPKSGSQRSEERKVD